MPKNTSLKDTGLGYGQQFACSHNLKQNIWLKVKNSINWTRLKKVDI